MRTTLKENFDLDLQSLRYILVYDIFNIEEDIYPKIKNEILRVSNQYFQFVSGIEGLVSDSLVCLDVVLLLAAPSQLNSTQ